MDENEYDRENFIKIGQTLDMPGEKEQLKRVPKKSWMGDNRRPFFIDNANSQKYYYMPIGDIDQHPHRNTLVPLGTFLGFINYRGQVPIDDSQYFNNENFSYYMRFSNYPYNSTENWNGPIGMDVNPLVYTDYPPVDKTIPLTYIDYLEQLEPGILQDSINQGRPLISGDGITGWGVSIIGKKGGKNTRKYKNRKTKNTRKYKKRKQNNKSFIPVKTR